MHFSKTLAVITAVSATVDANSASRHLYDAIGGASHYSKYSPSSISEKPSSFFSWLCVSLFGNYASREHVLERPGPPPSTGVDQFRRHMTSKYEEHMLLRFNVSTQAEQDAIYKAVDVLLLDVWSVANGHSDISVLARDVKSLMGMLPETLHSAHSTLSHDLSDHIYHTYPDSYRAHFAASANKSDVTSSYSDHWGATIASSDDLFFRDYQPLPVIVRWMQLLQAMFPSFVDVITIGQSYEGRDIQGLRVGVKPDPSLKSPRKTLLVTGGLHAREWISTSTVNYLVWSFVTRYGKDRGITKVLEAFDIVFVPVLNPDGYEYTWSTDRLWRKSRQPTPSPSCQGLDLDHAFGYGWDGSSSVHKNPCSEGFAGREPFQATEASQLADWARNVSNDQSTKFIGLIDLHSYSQQVLFPYSYSCRVDPPNLENLQELAAGLAKAIRLADGELYTISSACEGVVTMSQPLSETGGGSAIDWFYHEMEAHYSYQIKLQDTGIYGFLLPRDYIIPSGQEMLSAMQYLGDFLLGNNGIEHFDGSAVDNEQGVVSEQEPGRPDELKRRS